MLEVRQLAVTYGQHRALKGVDVQVAPGEIVVILGANGAGKTSLLKAVAGLISADAGAQVRLDGRVISGQPAHRIVEAGLALVPEGRGIFGDLSVRENLLLGAFAQRARATQPDNLDRVLRLFPRLAERSAQQARTMSGGEQQMVAIGRALMSAPTILMLDEPSLDDGHSEHDEQEDDRERRASAHVLLIEAGVDDVHHEGAGGVKRPARSVGHDPDLIEQAEGQDRSDGQHEEQRVADAGQGQVQELLPVVGAVQACRLVE